MDTILNDALQIAKSKQDTRSHYHIEQSAINYKK